MLVSPKNSVQKFFFFSPELKKLPSTLAQTKNRLSTQCQLMMRQNISLINSSTRAECFQKLKPLFHLRLHQKNTKQSSQVLIRLLRESQARQVLLSPAKSHTAYKQKHHIFIFSMNIWCFIFHFYYFYFITDSLQPHILFRLLPVFHQDFFHLPEPCSDDRRHHLRRVLRFP